MKTTGFSCLFVVKVYWIRPIKRVKLLERIYYFIGGMTMVIKHILEMTRRFLLTVTNRNNKVFCRDPFNSQSLLDDVRFLPF